MRVYLLTNLSNEESQKSKRTETTLDSMSSGSINESHNQESNSLSFETHKPLSTCKSIVSSINYNIILQSVLLKRMW